MRLALSAFVCGVLTLTCAEVRAGGDRTEPIGIVIDSNVRYQTIVGWDAVAQAAQIFPGFEKWADTLYQAAVDLGINRLRVDVRSGMENGREYWSAFKARRISPREWRCARYATLNDNADPFAINWSGFKFAELDDKIEKIVLPMKRRLEARGERLYLDLDYTAFIRQVCGDFTYAHTDPDEYAEFALAIFLHLRDKYGLVADAWEMILEPDNTDYWTGARIGEALVRTARRLESHGFRPEFIAPSTTSMGNAVRYFDEMIQVPGVRQRLTELSYHRYSGVSEANLKAIGERTRMYGVRSAMLEHIGSGYEDLHADLTVGQVSAWEQFTLAWLHEGKDDGGKYFYIDLRDKAMPRVVMGEKSRYLRQYFHYVRRGAVRIAAKTDDDAFDPVAFVNSDGRFVVVVKASNSGSVSVRGLPAGSYGATYATQAGTGALPDIAMDFQGGVVASIPGKGVLTVFARQ